MLRHSGVALLLSGRPPPRLPPLPRPLRLLPHEEHDFGASKRSAVYRFFAVPLGLDLTAVSSPGGDIDESESVPEAPDLMKAFNAEYPLPAHALQGWDAVMNALCLSQ
jgi:hypothetical protein